MESQDLLWSTNDSSYVSGSDDEDVDDEQHTKLLQAIGSLDKKKGRRVQERSEPVKDRSEFNLAEKDGKAGKVRVHELMGTLKSTASHSELKKQLINIQRKSKTLPASLPKHEAEKIERKRGYAKASKELSKWHEAVQANRRAEHLTFPLNQSASSLQTTDQFVKKFKPATPLEEEIYQMLHGSKHAERPDKEFTEAEEEALKAMSLEEAKARRAELQKARALQSYYESKCRRQKKIKSKKFHRIQKKAKAKEDVKKMHEMMENDPETAKEMMIKMDKTRAQERVSLKHRNTGKWAKSTARFGKYNLQAREQIQQQLQKSRDLTQKISEISKSDDEAEQEVDGDEDEVVRPTLTDINNPWFNASVKEAAETETKTASKTKGAHVRISALEAVTAKDVESDSDSDGQIDDQPESSGQWPELAPFEDVSNTNALETNIDNEEFLNEGLNRKQTLEDFADTGSDVEELPSTEIDDSGITQDEHEQKNTKEIHVDPMKVFTIKPREIRCLEPDIVIGDFESENKPDKHLMDIQEAFADDDVVANFQEDKKRKIDESKPKDIDLTLPGWGEWGGTGVKTSKKKKKRFIIKAPPSAPRQDRKLPHVFINEKRNKSVAMHQVNSLPFPFNSAQQFEANIRAPIGNTWNTEAVVKKLIKPKIATKVGTIIEPLSEADAFKDTVSEDVAKKNHRKVGGVQQKKHKRK
ncbi:U3 small nucleolar RNA-associated protein 14 homolog A-like [Anneissia japonica]|uniref:U3 small nucleolar RNA-associated protein 14 homolog A-like n=1 Tax=Anneissia japonica TaxID=1529436 RepID=UPI0014257BFC|nr:U3 small nucleolar RNA-associated protein 14 homolog A-like [Anneissia japonica]